MFGLTTPLITTADGAKMGKTAQGAVWLNADQLSPYDYWQFWRNTRRRRRRAVPAAVHRSAAREIARLEALEGAAINDAKIVLATEATAMLHGREAALDAKETAKTTFAGGAGEDLPTLGDRRRNDRSLAGADRARLLRLERRGQAQDRRGRGAARRCGGQRSGDWW